MECRLENGFVPTTSVSSRFLADAAPLIEAAGRLQPGMEFVNAGE
jgi:hypothetical protein